MGWLSRAELNERFASVGERVFVDENTRFYNAKKIEIGSDVRIDGGGSIAAGVSGIRIGDFVHLGFSVYVSGSGGRVVIDDFCSISARVSMFTATDDYSEGYLGNPTLPDDLKKVAGGDIVLRQHVIVGCGSVLLPGAQLGEGCSVGALTLVNKAYSEGAILFGSPPRVLGKRDLEKLRSLEKIARSRRV